MCNNTIAPRTAKGLYIYICVCVFSLCFCVFLWDVALTSEACKQELPCFQQTGSPAGACMCACTHTDTHTYCLTKTAGFGYDSFGLFVRFVETETTDTVYIKKLQRVLNENDIILVSRKKRFRYLVLLTYHQEMSSISNIQLPA